MHLSRHLLLFLSLDLLLLGWIVADTSETIIYSSVHVALVINWSERCRSTFIHSWRLLIGSLKVVVCVGLTGKVCLRHWDRLILTSRPWERIWLASSHLSLVAKLLKFLLSTLNCRFVLCNLRVNLANVMSRVWWWICTAVRCRLSWASHQRHYWVLGPLETIPAWDTPSKYGILLLGPGMSWWQVLLFHRILFLMNIITGEEAALTSWSRCCITIHHDFKPGVGELLWDTSSAWGSTWTSTDLPRVASLSTHLLISWQFGLRVCRMAWRWR